MPQNNFVEEFIKKHGRYMNYDEKIAKKAAREPKRITKLAQNLIGIKAKIFNQNQRNKKIQMKKLLKQKNEKETKQYVDVDTCSALPLFLLDRNIPVTGKEISNKLKEQRKEKSTKFAVPIPKVKGVSEKEAFAAITSGKRKNKVWKRMVLKPCFVGDGYTRKPPKYERFIRPMALRFKKAHVTHPELKTTFHLPIIGLKQNPHSTLFTSLGVLTKGTIVEVNVSELGIITEGGKVVWGKYAQITNHPENDGCVNAVLLV
ncbi:TGF-beta-inducible nuclear protein [Spraguea lophii 42_110]|uniref:TGF-beta-inducible nuclear protein n=1 Tax=Spraguea lophii (strain 42_110) TaxID=1358809 RepID=S7WA67_SPRLO|nr:TGF-beta-inducible nuclear protein [Spraguea lophii 42_110]